MLLSDFNRSQVSARSRRGTLHKHVISFATIDLASELACRLHWLLRDLDPRLLLERDNTLLCSYHHASVALVSILNQLVGGLKDGYLRYFPY